MADSTKCGTCDDGYYLVAATGVCTACATNCICTAADTCSGCLSGFKFTAGSPGTCE